MDPLAELINQIRSGNVILWAGSGFSRYAGYPDGKKLAEIIKGNAQEPDSEYFEDKQQLIDVAQEFTEFYGSERLIEILKSVFNEEPTSLQYHQLLAQIPQITHIITTNYDMLFEKAYGDKICSVVKDPDIPKSKVQDKVVIYKIHGSLQSPDTIIITKDDYRDFYANLESLVWTKVKTLISEYTILFLGYAFDDIDIQYLFDNVFKKLGDAPKEIFWISPNLPQHKLEHYSKEYPIRYINSTAEEAIPKIKEEVDKSLIVDAERGYVCPITVSKVLEDRGFIAEFRTGSKGTHITSVGVKDPDSLNTGIGIKLSLKPLSREHREIGKLYDLLSGRNFDEVQIASENYSILFKASAGGIDVPVPNGTEDAHLTITRQPVRKFTSSIALKRSEKCITNIKTEVFASKHTVQVVLFHPGFKMTLIPTEETENIWQMEISFEKPESVLIGKEIFGFFEDWTKDDEMLISSDLADIYISIPFPRESISKDVIEYIKLNSYIYLSLFKIQQFYGIRFDLKGAEPISKNDLDVMGEILTAIDDKGKKLDAISAKIQVDRYDAFRQRINPVMGPLSITNRRVLRCKLLNHDFELGHGVIEGQNMYISNEDEIQSQLENGESEIKVTFKSKTGDLYLRYCKDEGTRSPLPE